MSIPNINNFKELLETFTFESPDDLRDYETLLVANKSVGTDISESGEYRKKNFPEIHLWFKPTDKLSVNSLIRKIRDELEQNNHPSSDSLAKIILAVAVLHRKFQEKPIECLNKILQNFTTADLIQVFVFPQIIAQEEKFTIQGFMIGSFGIGKLKSNQLKQICIDIGCDFYDKYSSEYEHRLCIERQTKSIIIFNFLNCRKILSFPIPLGGMPLKPKFVFMGEMLARLAEEYFYETSKFYRTVFWDLLLEEQHLGISYGAPYFDVETPNTLHNSGFITIFLNIAGDKNSGWLEPNSTQMGINFAQADIRIPQVEESLRNNYNFNNFQKTDIHQTIKSYSLFVSKAKRHCLKHNNDEGFLHYVIALDLLLGEKGASTKSVTDRTAILVYRKFGKTFADQQKEIDKFYDIRSKYVHAGVNVSQVAIKEIESICEEVLHCLLRLQMQEENHSDGFIKRWLRNLDFLVKAVEADKEQEKHAYIENGIWYDET